MLQIKQPQTTQLLERPQPLRTPHPLQTITKATINFSHVLFLRYNENLRAIRHTDINIVYILLGIFQQEDHFYKTFKYHINNLELILLL